MAKQAVKAARRQKVPARPRARRAQPAKRAAREPAAPERAATLGALVEDLGAGILQVVAAPLGLDVTVTEPIIYDAATGSPIEKGDIVLAVGVRPEERSASVLIREAGARKAAAVVFNSDAGVLDDEANTAQVALVAIQPEMTWNQVHALLRTTIASAEQMPEAGVGGIPVGDLFALANAVAAMVGGPSTIEDPQSRVLAYSSLDEPVDEPRRQTILGRQVPESWLKRLHEAGVFRKLWSSDDVVRIDLPDKDLRPRLAIAIRAGGEILGSIWVQEGDRKLGPDAEIALREASGIAALHLIRHRASEDLDRQKRGELVRSLLEGGGTSDVAASRLGIEPKSQFTVLAFELGATDEADVAVQRERVLDLVALYCEGLHRRVSCVALDRTIYALLPSPAGITRARLSGVASEIIQRAEGSLRATLRAGIGSTVSHLREMPRSRWEADQALRTLNGNQVVADINDVRPHTILVELQDLSGERPHLKSGKLQVLVEHDEKRGTSYIETLRAYLDNFGDIAAASDDINVHPNTFRYRIRRLLELSGINLGDPTERLVTELQLRLL